MGQNLLKKEKFFSVTIGLIIVSFIVSTIMSIRTFNSVVTESNEQTAQLTADNIYNEINLQLQQHIDVGRTLANSREIIDILQNESDYSKDELEEIYMRVLGRYTDSLDYDTTFVVSDRTGYYFTNHGFNKVVSPKTDQHDVWYSDFLEKNKEYDFNIDTDEVNGDSWTFFMNVRVLDDDGDLLGVCGIGTQASDIKGILTELEDEYDIKVSIVDRRGVALMKMDDETAKKETDEFLRGNRTEQIRYTKIDHGYLVSRYMPEYDWLILIRHNDNMMSLLVQLLVKNLVVMVAIYAMLLILSSTVLRMGSRKMAENVKLNSYGALSSVYEGMYILDLSKDAATEIKNVFGVDFHLFDSNTSLSEQLVHVGDRYVEPETRQLVHEFFDISTLTERFAKKDAVSCEFISKPFGWCRGTLIPVRETSADIIDYFIFAIEVIDEAKKKQEALLIETETAKAASEAKGRFLANMSHEIRTPINAVLGMDTMILRESKEIHIREYAMDIQNAGQTLLSLINDILDFSKIESGKMEICPIEYDLSSLINDVVNMISVKAEQKGLNLVLRVDSHLPSGLFGDDVRIRQILINILSNAVKYTETGTVTLSVSGTRQGQDIILNYAVSDTGIGIKEEDMDKLFGDFERIDDVHNRHVEGTGLGMGITMQLLSLMGSQLNVQSVYGVGSIFSFDLRQPVCKEEEIGNLSERIHKNAENYRYEAMFVAPDAKILIVDDNDTNRVVFKSLLKETMVQIDEASGGHEAIAKVFDQKYDLIFMDHMMPDLDGVETLKRIKEKDDHPNADTPIIILTANAISGAKESYLAAGFSGYLSKPIIPDKLEKLLFDLLPEEKKVQASVKKEKAGTSEIGFADYTEELPSVEGINWEICKLYFPTKEDLCTTILNFYDFIKPNAEELALLYKEIVESVGDADDALNQFRIKVHAIKGFTTMLGMVPVAGMATMLEFAARDLNRDAVIAVTPYFLEMYESYKDKLSDFVSSLRLEPQKEIDDWTEIADYMRLISSAIQNFDVDGADAALAHLKEFLFIDYEKKLMDKLVVAIGDLDVETVTKLCSEMIEIADKKR